VRAAEVARRYGIAERVLRRWKQELAAAPAFVSVQITDAPAEERAP
jgi:transposase-like protein